MLGTRIAALRCKAGMSRFAFAKILGISPSAVAMYEQGRREPSCATLLALSQALGVTVQYLLSGDDTVDSSTSMLPDFLIQSKVGLSHIKKRRNCLFSDQEIAVLLAALLTMEDK